MIGRRTMGSKDVTLGEVTEILEQVSEEELGFEQLKTLAYSRKLAKLSKEKAEEMVKELMENEKLTRAKAAKIVDLMPKTPDEVKVLFTKEIYTLNDQEISKIIEIVGKYAKKE